jgi:hypothetical protein
VILSPKHEFPSGSDLLTLQSQFITPLYRDKSGRISLLRTVAALAVGCVGALMVQKVMGPRAEDEIIRNTTVITSSTKGGLSGSETNS